MYLLHVRMYAVIFYRLFLLTFVNWRQTPSISQARHWNSV